MTATLGSSTTIKLPVTNPLAVPAHVQATCEGLGFKVSPATVLVPPRKTQEFTLEWTPGSLEGRQQGQVVLAGGEAGHREYHVEGLVGFGVGEV